MNGSINGLQINCPEKVDGFFFFFIWLLIGKLWMKNGVYFKLITWKYLLLKNENLLNKIYKKYRTLFNY